MSTDGINFLSENLIEDALLSITTGSANAQFPVDNLKNESPSVKFRSAGDTVVIEIDLLQTRALDVLSVVCDPTGVFGLTAMTAKTSVTTDFSSSPVITVDLSAEHNIGYVFFTEVSHRFVEITFTGTGSFAEIGNIFIGKRINLPLMTFSVAGFGYGYQDKSSRSENEYGQVFTNERPIIKQLNGSLDFADISEQEEIDDMIIKHGLHEPLWVILDPLNESMTEGKFKLSMYGTLTNMPQWSASGGKLYNAGISMRGMV